MTATLCLLAFGAVMVYSASSPLGVLSSGGSGTGEFVRFLVFGAIGLAAMHVLSRRGLEIFTPKLVNGLLLGSFVLLVLVLVPGFGVVVNGARRWFAAGPIQFQPSEVMKFAIVLYVARYLADHPKRMRSFRRAVAPIAVLAGPACLLIVVEPDLGTDARRGVHDRRAAGRCRDADAVRRAAGRDRRAVCGPARDRAAVRTGAAHLVPSPVGAGHKSGAGYQAVQGQIALGSGGLFGVGLGRSVQKIFYLPEAQTDFILAVVGEELGVLGILGVVCLYGMIAYAGLRTARRAADRYAKLLATGLTSLILCQGILNIFVVLGLAPLTGVPLPFISYAPTNLCVLLAGVGLLLNIARPGRRLQVVRTPKVESTADRDRRRRDRRARRAGAGGGRRAAS